MPMIVTQSSAPVTRWTTASHHPHRTSQITLPIADATPASSRLTTVRPKGHRLYVAIRSEANPNGIVMIRMKQMIAAIR